MLPLLPFVGLAFATHVTTFDVNPNWTKAPFSGLESLSVDPAVVVTQLKPIKPPLPADVEPVANLAAKGEQALMFTNPMSQWSDLKLNGLPIGILGPYATMRLDGLKAGLYEITLEPPNHRIRSFAVRILPPPRVAPPIAVTVGRNRIDLSDKIYFDLDSADILPESFGLLDALAKAIVAHPEVLVLRVEGHTDSRGDDAYNQKLSEQRAAAVQAWLVKAGVPADRLTAVGFGESKPVDPAETEDAWEKNRRVDFIVEKHAEDLPPPPPVEDPKKKKKGH
jgi:outer membrane protein OmpA-like peptidoglycan-associated protein